MGGARALLGSNTPCSTMSGLYNTPGPTTLGSYLDSYNTLG